MYNFSDFNSMKEDIVRQNQNISEELIHSLINPFIDLKSTDFFEKIKLFNKDQISVCSLIFLKILNYYLRSNLNNKKLYKYLLKLHSDYLTDVDENTEERYRALFVPTNEQLNDIEIVKLCKERSK